MTSTNVPLSETLINLILINSESLAKDLKQYLKMTENIEVSELTTQLLDSLIRDLLEQFDNFNKNLMYTKEIENGNFSASERRSYYVSLYLQTVYNIITIKE
jgi:molecular chaperone GrpE (heat shock protein)